MKKNRIKKIKIWWKIPDLNNIPNDEARDLVFKTLRVASIAFYKYHNKMEEPSYFKSFWISTEASIGIQMYNFIVGQVADERVQYFAEMR